MIVLPSALAALRARNVPACSEHQVLVWKAASPLLHVFGFTLLFPLALFHASLMCW
jgi:hypothetical protein